MKGQDGKRLFAFDRETMESGDDENRNKRARRYRRRAVEPKNPVARIGLQLLDFIVRGIMEVFLPFLIELFAGILVICVVVAVAKEIVAWWWRKDAPEC